MRNSLTFGGVNSADYGIYISGTGIYDAPKRAVEKIAIPGRNGLLTIDQGRYENIVVEYPAFAFGKSRREFQEKIDAFRNAIASQIGYQRLQDTYHPDEYRMALYAEGLEVDVGTYGGSGRFTLSFECKPQRWTLEGEQPVRILNGGKLFNYTQYESEPLIAVTGYGTIAFGNYDITIENAVLGTTTIANEETYKRYNYEIALDSAKFKSGDEIRLARIEAQYHTYTAGKARFKESGSIQIAEDGYSNYESEIPGTVPYNTGFTGYLRLFDLTWSAGQEGYILHQTTINSPVYVYDSGTTTNATMTITARLTATYNGEDLIIVSLELSKTTSPDLGYAAPGVTNDQINSTEVIAESSVSILGNPTYIDCEMGEAYMIKGGNPVSLNEYIDLGSDVPKLAAGENSFDFSNTISKLVITPRWWKL